MKIFEAEKRDGLEKKIRANASVACLSSIEKWSPSTSSNFNVTMAALDINDLYPVKSVFVSSLWNKNDDVFGKVQMWEARSTPLNKPTNVDHDHTLQVGHITDVWVLDAKGNIIDDDIDVKDLPDLFHICDGSVIYRHRNSEELNARAETLIEEIETGKKFVSMECLFSDFDYAVISPDESYYVVEREEATAFLTKHLRSYGGTGQYNGYRVGRLLKNIVFSGKGFVDTPANPQSIIFNSNKEVADASTKFEFSRASYTNPFKENNTDSNKSSVYSLCNSTTKENIMSEALQAQLEKSQAEVTKANDTIDKLREQLAKSDVQKYEDKISKLEAELKKGVETLDGVNASLDSTKEELSKVKADHEKLIAENTELKNSVTKAEAEKTLADRISFLVSGDVDKEVATQKATVFASLDDEQWKIVASEIVEATKMKKEKDKENKEKEAKAEDVDEAGANVLDGAAQTNDNATASVSNENKDDIKTAQAELIEMFSSKLKINKNRNK